MGQAYYTMDAIRKKMQSLKAETDHPFNTIANFESVTKEANSRNDQHEADIRDLGKKIQGAEVDFVENKSMNSEVELEEGDKNLRETTKMASDNEQKLDELTRKLGVQEDELKRATDRAELAEGKLKDVEHELEAVGENMKQLEISAA